MSDTTPSSDFSIFLHFQKLKNVCPFYSSQSQSIQVATTGQFLLHSPINETDKIIACNQCTMNCKSMAHCLGQSLVWLFGKVQSLTMQIGSQALCDSGIRDIACFDGELCRVDQAFLLRSDSILSRQHFTTNNVKMFRVI